jgi:biofilm PGA synthesis N-glycosyltransferase PgaC
MRVSSDHTSASGAIPSVVSRRYVLLTAADEEAHIEDVIDSVLRQTVLPLAWFIIDDGSSDQTASIVERISAKHPFIHLQSADSRSGRNFASKDNAVMAAYALAEALEFDFVGLVDADQAPRESYYYETIFEEFDRNGRKSLPSSARVERWRPFCSVLNLKQMLPALRAIQREQ